MEKEQHQKCIKKCWECRHECQKTLFEHCLVVGGAHAQQDHVKFMVDCIEMCQLAADFMTRESELHQSICAACAEVCEACAESCEQIGNDEMLHCADICRACAQSCREMSEIPVT